ncbi:putative cell wall surface anchor family protein [Enterococcus sp. 5H]|nr:putative cell wall surface anchor family protein [Enterococcus sp. 5H]
MTLKLQNAGSEPVKVQITPHTAYTNVNGVVEYGKDAEVPDSTLIYSVEELIETPDIIELAGNEAKTVTLNLQMPDEEFEGLLAGGLRIAEVTEESEVEDTGEGVAIKNEFVYIIGVVLRNDRTSVQPDLELLDVFADQLNARNVISATIQNFTPTFVNRLAVEATVQREGETEVLYEAHQEQMQMAPNSYFDFPISLEGDRFRSGTYVLNMTARSGEHEWTWSETFTIDADQARRLNREDVTIDTSMNWWMIGALILLIAVIILVVILLVKRKKKPKKRKKTK